MIDRHAAGIFPVYPGGAILLQLRDDRPDVAAPNCWSTIGGHIEPGESPTEAAIRELEEETGRRPDAVLSAGYHDHPSGRIPGITIRSHLFATPARWSLDDLILGEGQRLDWFTPAEVPHLALAPALAPAIRRFLASDLHRSLAGKALAVTPPLSGSLPDSLCDLLGLKPRYLLAVNGISAGFVRRLADLPHGTRITASPGVAERPNIALWQPRGEPITPVFARWRMRLAPNGLLWACISGPESAALRGEARAAGLTDGSACTLPGGLSALRFRIPGNNHNVCSQ